MPTRMVLPRGHAPLHSVLDDSLLQFVIIMACMIAFAAFLQWRFAARDDTATSNVENYSLELPI